MGGFLVYNGKYTNVPQFISIAVGIKNRVV